MAMRLPVGVLLLHMTACVLLNACGNEDMSALAPQTVTGGVAERGRSVLEVNRYGCAACHVIPGVTGARGLVGPPLNAMGLRGYIAGRLPNKPENIDSLDCASAIGRSPDCYARDRDFRG